MPSLSAVIGYLQRSLIEPQAHIVDVALRHKARLLNTFLLPMLLVFAGVDAVYLATVPGYRPPWYGYVFLFGSYLLNRSRLYRVAPFLVLVMFPIVIFVNIVSGEATIPLTTLYYLVPGLILGGILLPLPATAFFALLEIAVILAMPIVAPNAFASPGTLIGPISAMVISAVLVLISMRSRDQIEADRQETLRKAEEKYRNILENSVDGIFQSTPEGKFLSVNSAMAAMYRYPSAEAMIQEIRDISHDLYVSPSQREDLLQQLEQDGTVRGLELQERRRDGSTFWVSISVRSVRDQDGKVLYYEGTVEDISIRKAYEAERENLIAELERKNSELEQFTYSVSHDLKAPLITIRGFLGLLAADASSPDRRRLESDIHHISEATDRMQILLSDLLDLSRIGRLMRTPENIGFRELVQEAAALVRGRLEAGHIELSLQADFPDVFGDRQRFLEVLQNLLENAAKFMGGQTERRIEVGTDGHEKGMPVFFVRDNGIGIAPEHYDRIFGLFNRLDPDMEGTGVGLALVKRIIEVHGGRIWLESEVGSGTTFYFTLPGAKRP